MEDIKALYTEFIELFNNLYVKSWVVDHYNYKTKNKRTKLNKKFIVDYKNLLADTYIKAHIAYSLHQSAYLISHIATMKDILSGDEEFGIFKHVINDKAFIEAYYNQKKIIL